MRTAERQPVARSLERRKSRWWRGQDSNLRPRVVSPLIPEELSTGQILFAQPGGRSPVAWLPDVISRIRRVENVSVLRPDTETRSQIWVVDVYRNAWAGLSVRCGGLWPLLGQRCRVRRAGKALGQTPAGVDTYGRTLSGYNRGIDLRRRWKRRRIQHGRLPARALI